MKKLLIILPTFTSVIINYNNINNAKEIFHNLEYDWSNIDLSKFTIDDKWDDSLNNKSPVNITDDDLNINISSINNKTDSSIKRWNIYNDIAEALDHKYSVIEENYGFIKPTMFQDELGDRVNYFKKLNISIQDKINSTEIGNNPALSFQQLTKFTENQISSFNLRISNFQSVDWNSNKSYFDVSVNVCNFDDTGNPVSVWNDDLNKKSTDTNGKIFAIDKKTDKYNYQTEDDCGSSRAEHWKSINVNLPFKDISSEITNLDTLSFFTKPNNQFNFSSKIDLEEQTDNHGTYNQYSNSNDKSRPINITKDDDSQDINIYSIDKMNQLYKDQHAYGNNNDGKVDTEAGNAADHDWHHLWVKNHEHARGYEDLFYTNDHLLLHSEGLTKTDIPDYMGKTYRFNFHYGEVEFDINWNFERFENNPN